MPPVCRKYALTGRCSRGRECRFIHQNSSSAVSFKATSPQPSRQPPLPNFRPTNPRPRESSVIIPTSPPANNSALRDVNTLKIRVSELEAELALAHQARLEAEKDAKEAQQDKSEAERGEEEAIIAHLDAERRADLAVQAQTVADDRAEKALIAQREAEAGQGGGKASSAVNDDVGVLQTRITKLDKELELLSQLYLDVENREEAGRLAKLDLEEALLAYSDAKLEIGSAVEAQVVAELRAERAERRAEEALKAQREAEQAKDAAHATNGLISSHVDALRATIAGLKAELGAICQLHLEVENREEEAQLAKVEAERRAEFAERMAEEVSKAQKETRMKVDVQLRRAAEEIQAAKRAREDAEQKARMEAERAAQAIARASSLADSIRPHYRPPGQGSIDAPPYLSSGSQVMPSVDEHLAEKRRKAAGSEYAVSTPGEQERLVSQWASDHSAKNCPRCRFLIQKQDGCNHVRCRLCRVHICWVCLAFFDNNDIYAHLRTVHGGIDTVTMPINMQDLQFSQHLQAKELENYMPSTESSEQSSTCIVM